MVQTSCNLKSDKEKMRKLSVNFPEFVDSELHKLCSEFIDIYALESEKISDNNFYKQRLRLKDNQPTLYKKKL